MTELQLLARLIEHKDYWDTKDIFSHIKTFICKKDRQIFFASLPDFVRDLKNDLSIDPAVPKQFLETFFALFDEQNGVLMIKFEYYQIVDIKILTADEVDNGISSLLQEYGGKLVIAYESNFNLTKGR